MEEMRDRTIDEGPIVTWENEGGRTVAPVNGKAGLGASGAGIPRNAVA
jgi:hypothetical protein